MSTSPAAGAAIATTEPTLENKTYTYQSGAVYEGTFKGTKRHGRGHWQHPDGEVFEGEYEDNKQHGLGVYVFGSSGKRYLGSWAQGEMSGEGIYYFTARSMYYVGGYEKDKKHGTGFYMYENGVLTLQSWSYGEMTSETEAQPRDHVEAARKVREIFCSVRKVAPKQLGAQPAALDVKTFQFPSGATYTGEYYGTKKHGLGYWLHPEGDSFEGEFEDNRHVGWGVYVTGKSGKKYVGQWEDGKMSGWGVYFFTPQETEYYVGQYRDDRKHGMGMYHFAESGDSKVMTWENGQLVKEFDADENTVVSFVTAIKRIVDIVGRVAPHYKPVNF